MKFNILNLFVAILIMIAISSCEKEVIDFTEVVNPNLSEDAIVGKANSSKALVGGLSRQLSIVNNDYVTISEIASDNYTNTRTFFNQALDNLTINFQDADINALQFQIARLRELANYGLDVVGPADPTYTSALEAEFHFYKGLALLLAGDYFIALPAQEGGTPLSSDENYNLSIESFQASIASSPSAKAHLAIARANYRLGNKTAAVNSANNALNLDNDLVFAAEFDKINGPVSDIESALFERGSFDDLQPLPSLDFLDPKYSFNGNSIDFPVAVLKAEEAYLIIAEAQATDNQLNPMKNTLKNLLDLVNSRPKKQLDDSVDDRLEADGETKRPTGTDVVVKYDGQDDFTSGLVKDRTDINVATVSGTSITGSDIEAVSTQDEALELIYILRQQIFIAEGIRAVDLGIKYILSENEIQLNNNVELGDFGTESDLPSFIDSIKSDLDTFTYDAQAKEVIIKYNLNRILVENKSSDKVLPFSN